MPGLTEKQLAQLRALAVASAEAQGLPARVQDAAILRRVAGLFRPGLAAPGKGDAAGVEAVAAGNGGADDGVVEDGGDDRGLAA
jgi:hypothetical protein